MSTKIDPVKNLTTEKMAGEKEQQYTAWLLYCEMGSLQKTLKVWAGVGQRLGESWAEFAGRLGAKPSDTTIEKWSVKYRWVERTDLRLQEELSDLKAKADRFRAKRRYLITDLLTQKISKLQKQVKQGEASSVQEVKTLWDMHRTEYGESTGKTEVSHRIDEDDQKPPDPEENQIGKEIDNVIKKHYDNRVK